MKRKIFSLFLAAALLLGLLPCALAQDDILHISTVEDLKAFAVNCTLVEYSVGLKVQLDNDLDLEGKAFNPIPSFSGSFDGGGHTISNFVLATDGSHQGFFRYLQEEGSIVDLNLEGRVEPDNSRNQVGGLVGSSYGSIENCSFNGKVTGTNYVGGIAGENYGSIKDCKSEGSISGKRFTGGIAGYNSGSIKNCENRSEVNTGISAGGLEIDKLNVEGLTLTGAEDTDVVSDSGGIVGFSRGTVEGCMNLGTVGYPHYGYNVGGIAGRQSGYITSCSNLGEIYGRKDVAGIVGQMEPYLKLLSSASLADEIRTLQAMISNLVANAGYLGDEVRYALANISNTAGQTIEDVIFNDWNSMWPDFEPGFDQGSGTTDPGSGTTDPGSGTTDQGSGTTDPGTGTTDPGTGTTDPGSGTTDPGSGTTDPGSGTTDPGTGTTNPGAGAAGSGTEQNSLPASEGGGGAENLAGRGRSGGIVLLSSVDPDAGTTDPDAGTTDPGTGGSGLPFPTPTFDSQALKENLDRMAADAQYFNTMLGATADSVKNDLSAVSYQLSKVLIMMANTLSGEKEINIYDDVSAKEPKTSTDGRVSLSVNRGKVEGDTNVGGIAGDMGIEYEFDLENQLMSVFTASNIISSSYQSKCIASENINYGDIVAKKDNAGGIAGQCQVGLVEECRDYGSVNSEEGSCIGGIVGRSMTLIRNCYAMSRLNGQEYVGGIAGYGVEIRDCASLVSFGDVTACCGCIAGWADMSSGSVSGNVYAHPSLGAVDGISYGGKAQALDYDSLLKTPGVPEEFADLKISFVADGELVAELPFQYGGSIDESQLPEVPEKPGYTGSWEDFDYSTLYLSDTVEAVYSYRQGTLAVDNPDPEEEKAIVLVEGDFDSTGRLSLREFTGEGPELDGGTLREKWVLNIENGKTDNEYSVHYLSPETQEKWGSIQLYGYFQGAWSKLDTVKSGSYLVFKTNEDTVVFCSVETEQQPDSVWFIAGGAVLAAAVLGIALARGKKRKKRDGGETLPQEQSQPGE